MRRMYDAEAAAAEREAKLSKAREALDAGLTAVVTGEDWRRTLELLAILGPLSVSRLSFGNLLLTALQRPGTRYAATFKGWQQVGRHVRRGEKGILIRQPVFTRKASEEPDELEADDAKEGSGALRGFRPLYLFALDQTDGPELSAASPSDVSGAEAFPESVEQLRRVALGLPGQPVSSLTLRERRPELGDSPRANGWFDRATREIVVITEGRARPAIFRTLVHELAHALLHGMDDHHSRPEREVEAESVAFVVCHALGLNTGEYSFPYVATWATGSGADGALRAVETAGTRIRHAARTILAALLPTPTAEPLPGDAAA